MRILTQLILPAAAVALAIPGLALQAQAQGADDEVIEEIITTGLHGKPRSAVDSAVPIDTFNAEQIAALSHTETQEEVAPNYQRRSVRSRWRRQDSQCFPSRVVCP